MSHCANPFYNKKTGLFHDCGHCPACLKARKRDWIIRMKHESEYYPDSSVFLTLTYANEHLKSPSLIKEDYQKFLKRLRRRFSYLKIRYYICGEYGSKHLRPHFHLILFGLPPSMLEYYKPSPQYKYNVSKVIDSLWPFGYNVVGSCSSKSISYVAGYVQKKIYGNKFNYYVKQGLLPPFSHCSHGIGKLYAIDHSVQIKKNLYLTDEQGYKYRVPRYYRKVLDITPETYATQIDTQASLSYIAYSEETGKNPIKSICSESDYMSETVELIANLSIYQLHKYEYLPIQKKYLVLSSDYLDWKSKNSLNYNSMVQHKVGQWSLRL